MACARRIHRSGAFGHERALRAGPRAHQSGSQSAGGVLSLAPVRLAACANRWHRSADRASRAVQPLCFVSRPKLLFRRPMIPNVVVDDAIDRALAEDLAGGDLTTEATVDPTVRAIGRAVA